MIHESVSWPTGQADEELRQSRQRYEDLVHSIDGIVWEAEADTVRFTFVSQQAERLLGYPVERWLAEPTFWQDHMHPDDRAWAVPFCALATAEKRPHEFEYRMFAADGRVVWLRDIVTVVVENDRPVMLRGVMVDITERKQAEAALRESEEHYRSIFDATTDGLVIRDLRGVFVEVNPAYCRMHGYSREELIGRRVTDLIHPDYRHLVQQSAEALAARARHPTEAVDLRKDGTSFNVEVHGTAFTYRGEPHVLAVVRDITQRRQAEEALREQEREYRAIFEATNDGLVITDVETKRILEANPAFCRMHGYEHMAGMDPTTFIHPNSHDLFEEYVRAAREGREFRARAQDVRRDGSIFDVEVLGRGFVYKGRSAILGVVRDVTEQVNLQQVLEQRVAERTRELKALLDISHSVGSTLELKPLLEVTLVQLKGLVDYTGTAILTLRGDELVMVGGHGPLQEGAPQPRRWTVAALGSIWETLARGETIIIPDVRGDTPMASRFRELIGDWMYTSLSFIRSCMWVPLVVKDHAIGLLSISHSQPDHYTPRDGELAFAVARQAAVAIENARLYEEARGKAALEERQKLARELHDSVSQALYGIALGARTARTLLDRDPARAAQPMDYVLSLAEAGLAEMRALIFELRPESLESEGLVAALGKQAASIRARHGLAVNANLGEEPDLPLDAKEALYRIVQEAFHNTVKHARASALSLRLVSTAAGTDLELADDGVGFDPGQPFPGHLGLRSMRERAASIGGALSVESAPGQGTRLRVHLPALLPPPPVEPT